jgi:23S rRNA (cytosine1962-C5)-methyltransferase
MDSLSANLAAANLSNPEQHESVTADVMDYLRDTDRQWDIVILDPPAFAKSREKRHQAVQGYKRLNTAGMKKVKPGGLLFTFSCSQVVDNQLFKDTILAAAMEAGCEARILHTLSQGPDHPVDLALPESSYLKGLVLRIN